MTKADSSRADKPWRSLCLALLAGAGALAHAADPQLGQAPLDEVIDALTLEEKVKLIRGTGMSIVADEDHGPTVGAVQGRVPGAAGTTYPIPRLGIPGIVLADGPAGLRISPTREGTDQTYHATAFPIATLLASSWDVELVENVGRAMGNEIKEYGVDILLAPGMNIHRYPLGGRNFEYYSEDPVVSGHIAAAMVNGVEAQGVGTSLKHYVANNHEWNRDTIDVTVDERALREIYLRGFEIAVKESKPWTIMSSYNKINGEYTAESAKLLTRVLRDQWGFDGMVMTDWFGGRNAPESVAAGNDLLMPGVNAQEQAVFNAVKRGELDEKLLDRNIANILRIVMASPSFKGYEYNDKPDLKANAAIARAVATEGMVLLKNTGAALPLSSPANLAVFGNYAYSMVIGGTGSGDVNEAYSVSLEDGLINAGLQVDQSLAAPYKSYLTGEKAKLPKREGLAAYMPVAPIPEYGLSDGAIEEAAATNDVALVTIGRSSGEFADRKADADFYLTDSEKHLLDTVSQVFRAQGKPVVVVLNIGGVIETVSWRDQADAILLAWQPGQEAGNAVADVLTGKVNPSGKLASTFGISLDDYPAAENFPGVVTDPEAKPAGVMQSVPAAIDYKDSIWVGYRHFNTRDVDVAYSFGYGLSYTDFAYSDIKLNSATFKDALDVSVTITNTGKVAGKEVAQLYVSAPEGGLEKPSEELRAFAKTRLLAPGESQTLSFTLDTRDLASFDPARNAWVAAAGRYQVKVGASSRDFRQTATFNKPSTSALSL